MVLHLSVKVIVLFLDINTAKAYLCNQDDTVSSFLSRLASSLLNLANKHGINLFPAHVYPSQNLSWLSNHREGHFQNHIFFT